MLSFCGLQDGVPESVRHATRAIIGGTTTEAKVEAAQMLRANRANNGQPSPQVAELLEAEDSQGRPKEKSGEAAGELTGAGAK